MRREGWDQGPAGGYGFRTAQPVAHGINRVRVGVAAVASPPKTAFSEPVVSVPGKRFAQQQLRPADGPRSRRYFPPQSRGKPGMFRQPQVEKNFGGIPGMR